ncbi:MAG TPA: TonB-dependent siderophore receptor [Sphingobium sp.]|uniref:TonB-dependent receptor n=1 Tax=Sphingobium sp. TaxID=1912891 RepID=UPI002ED07CAB
MSKSASTQSFLALSCVGAIAIASAAQAQEAAPPRKLGGVTVTDTALDERSVKAEKLESPKYTAPLVDTPQTITVISRASIEQQNLLTLRDVLSTVPGITFGAGEAGFGYGDRIILLGQDAKNDITVDGVRSGAVMNRNETYNIEQVEVTTGAGSVYSGGGSVAGTINLVTKRPLADDRTIVNAGIGTDNYYRATVDVNRRINDLIAVRLNAVYHQNDVPGRDVEYFDRWGVAPSVTIGIDSPTNLTFQYEHLTDHAMPQYGLRYFPAQGGFAEGFNRHAYYGFRNVDKQNSDTDSLQMIFAHEFSDTLRIRNLTRYEDIHQDTVTSQPAGTFCLPNGTNPAGGACTATIYSTAAGVPLTIAPGSYLPTGSRGNQRYIRNETAYNQFDLIGTVNTGSVEHSFVLGGAYLWQKYRQDTGNILRTAAGYDPYAAPFTSAGVTNPLYSAGASLGSYYPIDNLGNPSSVYTGPRNFIRASQNDGFQESFAAYLFDTMKFTDWLQLNGGVRFEHVIGENYTYSYSTTPGATLGQVTAATANAAQNPSRISNDLFSYRVGLVFKPLPNVSLYAAHGNAKLPSQSSVNDSCSAAATGATCNTNPQVTENYEIGAKAELFSKKLLVTAALFRNDRNYLVTPAADAVSADQVSEGKQRAQGVSVGASGNITGNWTISANYMYLDAYVRQSINDRAVAAGAVDPLKGSPLSNAPEHSGSLFTTYRFPFGLELGYGFNYQGSFFLNQYNVTTPSAPIYKVPSYITQRLMASYTINDRLKAQVNVQNLFNETYVTTVRNSVTGSWAQPGPTRQAIFSLTGTF